MNGDVAWKRKDNGGGNTYSPTRWEHVLVACLRFSNALDSHAGLAGFDRVAVLHPTGRRISSRMKQLRWFLYLSRF